MSPLVQFAFYGAGFDSTKIFPQFKSIGLISVPAYPCSNLRGHRCSSVLLEEARGESYPSVAAFRKASSLILDCVDAQSMRVSVVGTQLALTKYQRSVALRKPNTFVVFGVYSRRHSFSNWKK